MTEEPDGVGRCLLTIYECQTTSGKKGFWWDFPDKAEAFKIIGIMEAVKLELLDYLAEQSDGMEIKR